MPKHTKLTKDDRIAVATLKKTGHSQVEIAKIIGKAESTISRELARNKDPASSDYNYSIAHKKAKIRKAEANKLRTKIILNGEIEKYILNSIPKCNQPSTSKDFKWGKIIKSFSRSVIYQFHYFVQFFLGNIFKSCFFRVVFPN